MNRDILLLDDSPTLLSEVAKILSAEGFNPLQAQTADQAALHLKNHSIDFAVVDLFLDGDRGDELSNDFVREYLTNIPYVRLTSAPQLVPTELSGLGIISKQEFVYDTSVLIDVINETFYS